MGHRQAIGIVLYAALMTGLAGLVTALGTTMAHEAVKVLAFEVDSDPPVSRVDRGLKVQARVTEWQPVSHVRKITADEAPEQSAVRLASAIDAAEDLEVPTPTSVREPEAVRTMPAPKAKPVKPRVAGWIKRLPRPARRQTEVAESTARIIERRLRAEDVSAFSTLASIGPRVERVARGR